MPSTENPPVDSSRRARVSRARVWKIARFNQFVAIKTHVCTHSFCFTRSKLHDAKRISDIRFTREIENVSAGSANLYTLISELNECRKENAA